MKRKFYYLLHVLLFLSSASLIAQPANDNACDALEIFLDSTAMMISNIGATVETGEQLLVPPSSTDCERGTWCDESSPTGGAAIDHSLWFKFTAPSTTSVRIDLCGSTFNTQLSLYRASDCADFASYTQIWATDNQENCGGGLASTLRIECLEAGAEYMVLVDDWQAAANSPVDTGEVAIFIQTVEKVDPGVNFLGFFPIAEPICPGGDQGFIHAAVISGVEPLTVLWNTGATTLEINNLVAGTYSITVTDFCGTSQNASFDLEDPELPLPEILFENLDYEVVHPTHCGDAAYGGQIAVLANGGVRPFSYSWSTGDSLALRSNLSDGTYTVTVTDFCGINTAEKTYHLGMEAGSDIVYEMECMAEPIGLNHALYGGTINRITYNTDQSLLSGIACRGSGFIARNATWRSFDLATDFGITEAVNLDGVEVFISCTPNANWSTTVPVKYTAYLANTPLLDDPDLELIGLDSFETQVPEVPEYTSYLIPLKAVNLSPDDILVIKVETLTDSGDGHSLDFAANLSPTIQATYISSEDCGIDDPLNLDSIGFEQEIVMNVFLSDEGGLSYNWEGPVDDPTSPTPIALGTELENIYQVTITDEACGFTRTDQVLVTCAWANAMEELEATSFSIHPNPSSGYFYLSGQGTFELANCRVYNIHGQKIKSQQVIIGEGYQTIFDLSGYPSGIYYLHLASKKGTAIQRLIMQ